MRAPRDELEPDGGPTAAAWSRAVTKIQVITIGYLVGLRFSRRHRAIGGCVLQRHDSYILDRV